MMYVDLIDEARGVARVPAVAIVQWGGMDT